MSCLSEFTCSLYLDDELAPDERRAVDLHLVGCLRCREQVVALREEAGMLADVLLDRGRELAPATHDLPAARGLALGFGPVLGFAAAVTLAFGWLLDTLRPAGLDSITPLALRGTSDMAFDLIFLMRDELPGALEVALAVVAMASASALLTFALTAALRRWSGPGLLAFAALLTLALPVSESRAHFGMHEHPDFALAAGEVHDGTLITSGRNVSIDGVVEGDLVALSRRLVVRGTVRGNVIAASRDIELPGTVTGSVHVVGARVNVSGPVGGNLYGGGEHVTLGHAAQVGRDAALVGENVVVEGSVGRDLLLGGDWTEVRGEIARNVHVWAESLAFRDAARVGGNVEAWLPRGTEAELAAGAVIGGELSSEVRAHGRRERGLSRFLEARFYLWIALHVAAGFAVGMLLHSLWPALLDTRLPTASAFFRSLGMGFVTGIAAPVAIALVALTLVGIPLALMAAAALATALYLGGIVVATLIGRTLVHPKDERWTSFGLALLVGLLVLVFATHTPFVGGLVRVIAILTGLGLLVQRGRSAWEASRAG